MSSFIHSPSSTTINDLPEPLVVHILSFLRIQDAIRTSRISRKFRNLWHLMPSLNFDISKFYSRSASRKDYNLEFRQLFADFVSHTLLLRPNYPLTKFVLRYEFANIRLQKRFVQSLIRYAINLSISELVIDFGEDYRRFDFLLSDIFKGCIKVLKLVNCILVIPPITNHTRFVSLKLLVLERLEIDGKEVCNLLARCVNLETLKFITMDFSGPEGIRIYSATLKELYVECCWNYHRSPADFDLDIGCPSLQKISLINLNVGNYIMKDTTLLVEACVDFRPFCKVQDYNQNWGKLLSCFSNISSLHVWDELLESNEVPIGCEQYASNVKHLELYIAYNEIDIVGLAALLKLLPKLEILRLHNRKTDKIHYTETKDPKFHKDYWRASTVFNMPCLKKVILRKYQKTNGEQHLIELFKKNSVELEKLELLDFSTVEN